MTSSSLILGLAGVFALFAPDVLLSTLGVAVTGIMSVLVQVLSVLTGNSLKCVMVVNGF
ncbi:MAG TPA: hypothetical protein VJL10_04670 [Anaerolineales bacterium]|nr:hypothetical protein [Anaerolineales bacterium]